MFRGSRRAIALLAPIDADMPGAELANGPISGLLLVVALLGPGKPSADYPHGIGTGTPSLTVDGTSSQADQRTRRISIQEMREVVALPWGW